MVVTANDGGAAWTPDEGTPWFTLPGVTGFWAVAFAIPKAGWLVGTDGRILKLQFLAGGQFNSNIAKQPVISSELERSREIAKVTLRGFSTPLGMTFMVLRLPLLWP